MSSQEIITTYPVAAPERQSQSLPGLDKRINPHLEYTKLEVWDDNGKPSLVEHTGPGNLLGKPAIITGGDSGIGRAAAIMFAREGASGITITHLPEEIEDAKDAKKMIEDSGALCNVVLADLGDAKKSWRITSRHSESWTYSSTMRRSRCIRVNAVAPGPIVTALQAGSRSEENMEGWGVGTPLYGRAGQSPEVGPSYVFLASNIMTGQVIHVNSGEHSGGS
ncbi:hypothetical protein NLJ89_g9971 [Agrocybe chaxingu]|uniref:NAD(P)-binding protein n=1 Tax=Agrocybe chaxingu TaxID=84603 RepID=A0A9W8JZ10_9AGAR|nr:hypothetical protein NLJ89_g9971 [Agrocybe chaxingu]